MKTIPTRRDFLKGSAALATGFALASTGRLASAATKRDFKISVAGWSLHREVFSGKKKQIELFKVIREEFDIGAFELVNTMLEVPTARYIRNLSKEASKYKVEIPLIMVDAEGSLGDTRADRRKLAVRNHEKWIYAASDLGCHSIRVNWRGEPKGIENDPAKVQEHIKRSADTYRDLVAFGEKNGGIKVIIENHGGWSSDPKYLIPLMKEVDSPNFGTLPDFGNFPSNVDRYDGIDKMMPYAKALSAKCKDFDSDGNHIKTDFKRMIEICVDKHGYHGYIGIEYEGSRISERDGIRAARDLLLKLRG
jgi:L-ribulose-5-phosphate 3-epimerase